MFGAKIRKIAKFSTENFQFLKLNKSLFIAWASFRYMPCEMSETAHVNLAKVGHLSEFKSGIYLNSVEPNI